MNLKNILLIIISNAIASALLAQIYSANDIYLKSFNAIQNFNKGSFTVSVQCTDDSSFQFGQLTFYKDSVDEGEIPQFFLVQINDTMLVYDGDYYYEINKEAKTITVGRESIGELRHIGPIVKKVVHVLDYSDFYFRNSRIALCYSTYPYKVEGIETVDSHSCFRIKDTLVQSSESGNDLNVYGLTYIDTSTYLLIKKIQFCKNWVRTMIFSQINKLTENNNFTFDVNLFALHKQYKIEKGEEWGEMTCRPKEFTLTDSTNTKFILDSTRTIITAIDTYGKIIWSTDPLKQINYVHLKHNRPLIISFSLMIEENTKKEVIGIKFDNLLLLYIYKDTGKFGDYLGSD